MDCPLPVVLLMKAENITAQQKEVIRLKKIRTGILAAALLLSIGVTGAFAAGASCRYDADGDGLCDNCGGGANYVDSDNDGVCDHWGGSRCGLGRGMGRGYKR